MQFKGMNFENIKQGNRSSILRILNNNGPMSRKDIAGAVGLTAASVTLICNDLLEEGVIAELGEAEEEKRAGRKKILVNIVPDYRLAICVDIEPEETFLSLTDLRGNVRDSVGFLTDRKGDPGDFLRQIAGQCKRCLEKGRIPEEKLLGVAVTIPGKVDRQKGISLNSYSVWKEAVPIKEILETDLGLPVTVENNLKAYAQTEIDFGRGRTEENLLILKWGPGVGSSIIIGHRIYQGASGMAAEIGHMASGRKGRLCNCGRKGCLETEVSTHAVIADVMGAYEADPESMPVLGAWLTAGGKMTYRNVAEWGRLQDPGMRRILTEKLDLMAHTVRNAVSLIDPERVILMGYMFDVPEAFEEFRKLYAEYDRNASEDFFMKSELSESLYHTEGLAVLMEELFF